MMTINLDIDLIDYFTNKYTIAKEIINIKTHSNYCDMMFEIKDMKIVIKNYQLHSTTANHSQPQPMPAQALLIVVNNCQQ